MSVFEWKLPVVMADRGMRGAPALRRALAIHGYKRSESQVYRLIANPPKEVSIELLAILCDIFQCEIFHLLVRRPDETEPPKDIDEAFARSQPASILSGRVVPFVPRLSG